MILKKTLKLTIMTVIFFAGTAHANAAPNFQFVQDGNVRTDPFSQTNVAFGLYQLPGGAINTLCTFGSCVSDFQQRFDSWNGTPKEACEYALSISGLSDATQKTCSYEKYTGQLKSGDCVGIAGTCTPLGPMPVVPVSEVELFEGSEPAESLCNHISGNGTLGDYMYNWVNYGCSVYTFAGTPPLPTATLTAAPTTIISGDTSLLTYSCTNGATSASIDNGIGPVTPAAAGSFPVAPTITTTYTLTCTNVAGTGTGTATVSLVPVPSDLISGAITPNTATEGVPVTLQTTISNIGLGSTVSGFTTLFQRATDALGTGSTDLGTSLQGALASSASAGASYSYTFPTNGTWFVRGCADKNSAGDAGTITETSEVNNCGPWTAVTVASGGGGSISSCTVSSNNPLAGVPVTYTATLSGLATPPFTWTPSLPVVCLGGAGSTNICTFTANGTYTMNVEAVNAPATSCSSVTVGCVGPAPTGTLTAAKTRVQPGTATTISYNISGAVNSSCSITGPNAPGTIGASACVVSPANGIFGTGIINTQTVYRLSCDGNQLQQVIVNVVPIYKEI